MTADATSNITPLTLDDYVEIHQLVAQYAYALDSAADSGYMYASLFTEDGTACEATGRDNLARLALSEPDGVHIIRHFPMPAIISPSADGRNMNSVPTSKRSRSAHRIHLDLDHQNATRIASFEQRLGGDLDYGHSFEPQLRPEQHPEIGNLLPALLGGGGSTPPISETTPSRHQIETGCIHVA